MLLVLLLPTRWQHCSNLSSERSRPSDPWNHPRQRPKGEGGHGSSTQAQQELRGGGVCLPSASQVNRTSQDSSASSEGSEAVLRGSPFPSPCQRRVPLQAGLSPVVGLLEVSGQLALGENVQERRLGALCCWEGRQADFGPGACKESYSGKQQQQQDSCTSSAAGLPHRKAQAKLPPSGSRRGQGTPPPPPPRPRAGSPCLALLPSLPGQAWRSPSAMADTSSWMAKISLASRVRYWQRRSSCWRTMAMRRDRLCRQLITEGSAVACREAVHGTVWRAAAPPPQGPAGSVTEAWGMRPSSDPEASHLPVQIHQPPFHGPQAGWLPACRPVLSASCS